MRCRLGPALGILAMLCPATSATAQVRPRLSVVVDVSNAGVAGDRWLALLRKWLADSSFRAVAQVVRPLTARERRWAELIRERRTRWEDEVPALAAAYAPARPPELALVVLGNRGGEDAFVHDGSTIGFDLSALEANYGAADDPENGARIDRFFRHEYVHLMQKAWLAEHPVPGNGTLDLALLDVWTEALGNYYSFSPRWRGPDGSLTDHARRTLAELEPRFIARMAAVACAPQEAAATLTADLSAGPFAEKWGALPAALWLAADEADSAGAIRRLVVAGPSGVWALAERRMAPSFRPVLGEIRAAAERCARPRQ